MSLRFLDSAISRGLGLAPDLICLTGDYVTAGSATPLDGYVEVLRRLSSYAPTFAVLGNHDGGRWSLAAGGEATVGKVSDLLREASIEVLDNRSMVAGPPGAEIRLVGVGDLWGGGCDPAAAFASGPSSPSTPTLFLAHNPDTKDIAAEYEWDLMLSGHTHGGQVVLPIVGPPIVPVRDRRFVAGLRPWKDRQIYTTRGVGNLYGLRFNCRPEVAALDLG